MKYTVRHSQKKEAKMKITKIWFDENNLYVTIDSGHTIGNPLEWFPRLQQATPEQRNNYVIGKFADDISWEEIDEDISLESLFDFKRELN